MNKQAENIDRLTDFALDSFGIENPIKEKEQEEETFTMYAVCPVCNKVNVFDISDEEYEANCWYSCTYCEKEIQLRDYMELTEDEVKTCPTCRRLYTEKEEVEFIEDIGECGTCDHVRGEVLDDQHSEAVKNWDGETDQDKWTTDAYLER